MKTETSTYEQQAIDFLNATNATIDIKFSHNGLHFNGDTEPRDIYKVKIKRGNRSYSFDFGNSINDSGFYYTKGRQIIDLDRSLLGKTNLITIIKTKDWDFKPTTDTIHKPVSPTEYSILACLTKNDPGTFEDFCGEFGYELDSHSAKKIYKAVAKEYDKICSLFTDEEIEQLQEIQ